MKKKIIIMKNEKKISAEPFLGYCPNCIVREGLYCDMVIERLRLYCKIWSVL